MKETNLERSRRYQIYAAHRLATLLHQLHIKNTFKRLRAASESVNIISSHKHHTEKTQTTTWVYPEQLSYKERKSVNEFFTPRALELRERKLSDMVFSYKLASSVLGRVNTPINCMEGKLIMQLDNFDFITTLALTRSMSSAWNAFKEISYRRRVVEFALIRLKSSISKINIKINCSVFEKLIEIFLRTKKGPKSNRERDGLDQESINHQTIVPKINKDIGSYDSSESSDLRIFRLDTFGGLGSNTNLKSFYLLSDEKSFNKRLQGMEKIFTKIFKTKGFTVLKDFHRRNHVKDLTGTSRPLTNKHYERSSHKSGGITSSRSVREEMRRSLLLLSLLHTIFRGNLQNRFNALRLVKPMSSKRIGIPLKHEPTKTQRVSAKNRTRMIFLICHRIAKQNLKSAFEIMARAPKRLSSRMKVAYGKIRDLRRSCTPSKKGNKKISYTTNDPSFRNLTRDT